MDVIKELQDRFYSTQNKKMITGRTKQREECCKFIYEHLSLEFLLGKFIFNIDETNCIYIDYQIFKSFAYNETYEHIINYSVALVESVIAAYGSFNIYLDINGLTISAIHRHSNFIKRLNDLYNDETTACLQSLTVLNTTHTFNLLYSMLFEGRLTGVKHYNPHDSRIILEQLFPASEI